MSRAAYFREWRAKHGARTGQIGRPISAPCGTPSAYKRHVRKRETPCSECRNAWRTYQQNRRKPLTGEAARSNFANHGTTTEGETNEL